LVVVGGEDEGAAGDRGDLREQRIVLEGLDGVAGGGPGVQDVRDELVAALGGPVEVEGVLVGGVLGDDLGLGHAERGEEARAGVVAGVDRDGLVRGGQARGDEGRLGHGRVLLADGGEVGGELLGELGGGVAAAGGGADGGQHLLPGGGVVRGE